MSGQRTIARTLLEVALSEVRRRQVEILEKAVDIRTTKGNKKTAK